MICISGKSWKNSYHISGTDDNSKSVISPTYSADKLCEITFRQFSRSCVKITTDKRNRKITRLPVTSTFNSKIGWSNFDRSIHKKGNEDSQHFLAMYQRHRITGLWFILSIQVVNWPFLQDLKNSPDCYVVNRSQGQGQAQGHQLDANTVQSHKQN